MQSEEFKVVRPKEYHDQLVNKGRREDGRRLEECRTLKLEVDAIRTADASCLVKLGNTSLVCGCRYQVLNNSTLTTASTSEININVELPPICSGPKGTRSLQVESLISRTLRNIIDDSSCIDKQKLHIPNKDAHFSIELEVICLNYDGCLLDAALAAILASLRWLKMSAPDHNISEQRVELNSFPSCLSFAIINDRIVCDPNATEENFSEANFSITIHEGSGRVCNVTKLGGKAITCGQLNKCIQLAKNRVSTMKDVLGLVGLPTSMHEN